MKGGTFFSGIGTPEVSCPEINWRWCAEIDRFANAVSEYHRPGVINLGNMEEAEFDRAEPVDVVVFGSPCQSFSVAGKRLGMDDPRGNLALVALAAIGRIRPNWFVFENVPGLLSSDDGRDFGAFLGAVGELGYGWAYRVLDAQHFGVPQRRRRIFLVGHSGGWAGPAAVLFERESLSGHPAPSRAAREDVTGTLSARTKGGGGLGTDTEIDGGLVAHVQGPTVSPALKARYYKGVSSDGDGDGAPLVTHSLRAEGFDASEDGTGRGTPVIAVNARQDPIYGEVSQPADTFPNTLAVAIQERAVCENPDAGPDGKGVQEDIAYTVEARSTPQAVAFSCKDHGQDGSAVPPTLRAMPHDGSHENGGGQVAVAIAENQRGEVREMDVAPSLDVGGGKPGQGYPAVAVNLCGREGGAMPEVDSLASIRSSSGGSSRSYHSNKTQVRRLTPRECERLQGIPDDYTKIPWRGKTAENCPDGPRYKAIGNAMAVPVVGWVLKRLLVVDDMMK